MNRTCAFRLLILTGIILVIAGCIDSGGGHSDYIGTNVPVDNYYSSHTGSTYDIHVFLPPGYNDSPDTYPVLFSLDGPGLHYYLKQIVAEEKKYIILVAISNAGERNRDYTGSGCDNFFNFLTNELIPYTDALYRIDASDRGITGHSLGGLSTVLTLLLEDPYNRYFKTFISLDGTFIGEPTYSSQTIIGNLELDLYHTTNQLPVTLILARGSAYRSNYTAVSWCYNLFNSRDYQDLNLILLTHHGDHDQMIEPTLRDAVNIVY